MRFFYSLAFIFCLCLSAAKSYAQDYDYFSARLGDQRVSLLADPYGSLHVELQNIIVHQYSRKMHQFSPINPHASSSQGSRAEIEVRPWQVPYLKAHGIEFKILDKQPLSHAEPSLVGEVNNIHEISYSVVNEYDKAVYHLARTNIQMQQVAEAITHYETDHGALPSQYIIKHGVSYRGVIWDGPTYPTLGSEMTTPVAYISPEFLNDPFTPYEGMFFYGEYGKTERDAQWAFPFRYLKIQNTDNIPRWAIVSRGPDSEFDIINQHWDSLGDGNGQRRYHRNLYDPTNGILAGGDLMITDFGFGSPVETFNSKWYSEVSGFTEEQAESFIHNGLN